VLIRGSLAVATVATLALATAALECLPSGGYEGGGRLQTIPVEGTAAASADDAAGDDAPNPQDAADGAAP